ncbi:hypothetical protein AB1L30_03355 [Bremerella sp. JC817]|uniref:hypothetical protein n=1 Tax=Bremerella sp. JC817 TaxID=3231756 RepID=UPI003457CBC3
MSHDETNESNPFSSPMAPEIRTAATNAQVGPGFLCDGTALDSFAQGGKLMGEHFWLLLGLTVLSMVIRAVGDYLDNAFSAAGFEPSLGVLLLGTAYNIFISIPVGTGLAYVFLLPARGQQFELGDLFAAFQRNYIPAVAAGFVKVILIMLGFVLLVVPGIYLAIKFAFVEYLVIDRKLSTLDSLKESWHMTNGHELTLLVNMLLSILIFIGGMLLCLVGVVFSIMWISAAYAVLFYYAERLRQDEGMPEPESTSDNPFAN